MRRVVLLDPGQGPGVCAAGLGSTLEPGTAYDDPRLGQDPQVGTMDAYVDTDEDNAGVRISSGIPNGRSPERPRPSAGTAGSVRGRSGTPR